MGFKFDSIVVEADKVKFTELPFNPLDEVIGAYLAHTLGELLESQNRGQMHSVDGDAVEKE